MLREVLGAYGVSTDGLYTFDFLGAQDHTEWVIRVNEDEKDMKRIRESLCLLIPPLPALLKETTEDLTNRIESIKKNYAYRHPIHVGGPSYGRINGNVMSDVLGYGESKATDIIGSWSWSPTQTTQGERMALHHRYSVIGWTPVNPEGFNTYKARAIFTNDKIVTGSWKPEDGDGTWFLHAWGVNLEGEWTLDYNYCFPGPDKTFQIAKYKELMNQMFKSIKLGIEYVVEKNNNKKDYVVIRIPQLGLGAWITMVPGANILQIYELYGAAVNGLSLSFPEVIILYPIYHTPEHVHAGDDSITRMLTSVKSGETESVTGRLYDHIGKNRTVTKAYTYTHTNYTYLLWGKENIGFSVEHGGIHNTKFEQHADPFGTFDRLHTFLNGRTPTKETDDVFKLTKYFDEFPKTFEWILVNAWDDGSFIGNIGVKDPTQDGWTVAGSTNKPMTDTKVPSDLPGVERQDIPLGFQTENAAYLHNAMFHTECKVFTEAGLTEGGLIE